MSTLTGTFISQSYGSVIHLSTNTGIVAGASTQLEDGLGNALGLYVNTNGSVTASNFAGNLTGNVTGNVTGNLTGNVVGNLTGTASYATVARNGFPFSGSATITGSLSVTGSTTLTGSFSINGVSVGRGNWQATTASYTAASASSNIAIGSGSLGVNYSSPRITAIGHQALANAGAYSSGLDSDTDSADLVAVGYKAGFSNNRWNYSTYLGSYAGAGDQGEGNTAIGYNTISGKAGSNVGGWYNTAVGANALGSLSASLSFQDGAPNPTNGLRNVAVGFDAAGGVVTGNDNIGIGYRTLYANNGAQTKNIAIGTNALVALETGSANIVIGHYAASIITSGSNNLIIGNNLPTSFVSGSGNTIIGNTALYNPFVTGSGSNTFLNNNIIVADGNGSVRLRFDNTGSLSLNGPTVVTASAAPSTHKVQITINNQTYFLLATTS